MPDQHVFVERGRGRQQASQHPLPSGHAIARVGVGLGGQVAPPRAPQELGRPALQPLPAPRIDGPAVAGLDRVQEIEAAEREPRPDLQLGEVRGRPVRPLVQQPPDPVARHGAPGGRVPPLVGETLEECRGEAGDVQARLDGQERAVGQALHHLVGGVQELEGRGGRQGRGRRGELAHQVRAELEQERELRALAWGSRWLRLPSRAEPARGELLGHGAGQPGASGELTAGSHGAPGHGRPAHLGRGLLVARSSRQGRGEEQRADPPQDGALRSHRPAPPHRTRARARRSRPAPPPAPPPWAGPGRARPRRAGRDARAPPG